jgi:hypothetical protein
MKTPRVKDFDPNSKEVPVLKSSLDNMPVIQKPKPSVAEAKNKPVPPVRVVPLVPPVQPQTYRSLILEVRFQELEV